MSNMTFTLGGTSLEVYDEEARETLADVQSQIGALEGGAPTAASTVAEMTDTGQIYVYTGSEDGYTNGDWYYYNGSAWTDGGTYGANRIDDTLTLTGYGADAATVGDELTEIKSDLNEIIESGTVDLQSIETQGYYVGTSGNIGSTSGTFAYASPIAVECGYTYTFVGRGTTIMSSICTCDSSGGSRASVYTYSSTDTEETFVYTPTSDGYILVCYNYSYDYSLKYEGGGLVNELKTAVEDISETSTNLLDMSAVQLGKNWYGGTASNRAVLYFSVEPYRTYYFDFPATTTFTQVNAVQKASSSSGSAIKSNDITLGGVTTLTMESTSYVVCLQFAKSSTITSSDFEDYEPYVCMGDYSITANDKTARINCMPWEGKTLVWLGTSIPAGGKYDVDNPASYPIMVGEMLGATVYNEAVGSSALHCKSPSLISDSNPYGFLSNFEAVSRCITNSLDEMEYIIENYNNSDIFTENVPSSLSDDDKEFIRSCSWENKLGQYFSDDAFPDAWIIDHGHNDIPSETTETTYTDKTEMSGTQNDGYYTGGSFVESTASSYIEYDVTDYLYVWISGTFGSWYDVYDIYDSDGNNIGYTRNSSQTEVDSLCVDVSNATTLRVSNINTLISTVVVERLTYPTYNSLYSYQGCFDFIVNKILTYNPQARIIMIGEYENQKYPTISENQEIAAERWEIPLYRQWENLGWSQQPILVDGEYVSMLNAIIPDNLHPHTDTTGYALKKMAQNIALWLNGISI